MLKDLLAPAQSSIKIFFIKENYLEIKGLGWRGNNRSNNQFSTVLSFVITSDVIESASLRRECANVYAVQLMKYMYLTSLSDLYMLVFYSSILTN